jgi:hypothetical protein
MSEPDYSGVHAGGAWWGKAGWALAVLGLLLPIVVLVAEFVYVVMSIPPDS